MSGLNALAHIYKDALEKQILSSPFLLDRLPKAKPVAIKYFKDDEEFYGEVVDDQLIREYFFAKRMREQDFDYD
jgi:hypothetical protein